MPRQPPRPVSFVRSACLLAALALPAPARAAEVQTLTLRDGSTVTGEVIEFVRGDHVTVQTAPGQQLRLDWSTLAVPARAPQVETAAPSSEGVVEEPRRETPPSTPPPGAPGTGRRLSAGLMTGFPAPLGYLAVVVDGFPFPASLPTLHSLGVEVAAAIPIAGEPPTFSESVLSEYPLGTSNFGLGFGLGVAQTVPKAIVPGDHPGVVLTALIDARLGYRILPQLSVLAGPGLGYPINGAYCTPHPEACPQAATGPIPLHLYGTFAVMGTLDFDNRWR